MSADKWLTRLIGLTVCVVAVVVVAVDAVQVFRGKPVQDNFAQLVALVIGALLGRLTTSQQHEPVQVQPVAPEYEPGEL